jgi:hypothetical protein
VSAQLPDAGGNDFHRPLKSVNQVPHPNAQSAGDFSPDVTIQQINRPKGGGRKKVTWPFAGRKVVLTGFCKHLPINVL